MDWQRKGDANYYGYFQGVHSMTAYFGAGPIVKALEMGADIVVTGRTADSSMALAPCVHNLKWDPADFDKMAMGSLAGDALTSASVFWSRYAGPFKAAKSMTSVLCYSGH